MSTEESSVATVGEGRIAITGAFSYTGKYVTRLLLDRGFDILTLTGHPDRPDPFGGRVKIARLQFVDAAALADSIRGADVLINTYWIRFPYRGMTYEKAVENTKTLFRAALAAGVKRIVHVSITNPRADSPLEYFRGKAELETFLASLGIPHAILRPTVIFGPEDILINNVAWCIRRFPFLPVLGDGSYKFQPIFVEDFAEIIADAALRPDTFTSDAAGPEIFGYLDHLKLIRSAVGRATALVPMSPRLAWRLSNVVGMFLGDVVLTWDEVIGLMDNLLVSSEPPLGKTKLSDWIRGNAATLGMEYHSEVARHY
ncbi:MAG: NAD(P)H-binding protein [bacterium]|jgi:NADH dehydrogenase